MSDFTPAMGTEPNTQHAGNEKLANFYAERFPPDVKKAYEAWLAQKPFENPNADAHPFVPNLYQVRGAAEATATMADAAARVAQARDAGNRSGQYLANTVLFATVLFLPARRGSLNSHEYGASVPRRRNGSVCHWKFSSLVRDEIYLPARVA